jgi:hypothetical protein
MNIRELIKQDQGIDISISGGNGDRDNPFVVDAGIAAKSAYTQMQLINAISSGLGRLWRIKSWESVNNGNANEVIHIETLQFDSDTIVTETRAIYFDTHSVDGAPHLLQPLIVWKGPPGTLFLPYELGWLHFNGVINNSEPGGEFDQTIQYRGSGANANIHASIHVYERSYAAEEGARYAELNNVCNYIIDDETIDPWPVKDIGPFAMKFLLAGENITVAGVAVSGNYFIKIRLTHLDDLKMREIMNVTLSSLIQYADMSCE